MEGSQLIPMLLTYVEPPDDREFLTDLFLSYQRLMFSVAGEYVSDWDEREEIVQNSLVKIVEQVSSLRSMEKGAALAYIIVIVRHMALNHLRHGNVVQKHTVLEELDELDPADQTPAAEEALIRIERLDALRRIWPKLRESDRYLLQARYFAELSDDEIAEVVGCKPDSVRSKLSRARSRAREAMRKEGLLDE